MLGSHGLFTWGNSAYESYLNTLEVIEICSAYIEESIRKNKNVFNLIPINIIYSQVSVKEGLEKEQTLEWLADNSSTTDDIKAKIKEGEFVLIK